MWVINPALERVLRGFQESGCQAPNTKETFQENSVFFSDPATLSFVCTYEAGNRSPCCPHTLPFSWKCKVNSTELQIQVMLSRETNSVSNFWEFILYNSRECSSINQTLIRVSSQRLLFSKPGQIKGTYNAHLPTFKELDSRDPPRKTVW